MVGEWNRQAVERLARHARTGAGRPLAGTSLRSSHANSAPVWRRMAASTMTSPSQRLQPRREVQRFASDGALARFALTD